jgi:hypothetical protein
MGSAALFTALLLHTPLRWVLGGPVRAEQRDRLGPERLTTGAPTTADDTDDVELAREPVRV